MIVLGVHFLLKCGIDCSSSESFKSIGFILIGLIALYKFLGLMYISEFRIYTTKIEKIYKNGFVNTIELLNSNVKLTTLYPFYRTILTFVNHYNGKKYHLYIDLSLLSKDDRTKVFYFLSNISAQNFEEINKVEINRVVSFPINESTLIKFDEHKFANKRFFSNSLSNIQNSFSAYLYILVVLIIFLSFILIISTPKNDIREKRKNEIKNTKVLEKINLDYSGLDSNMTKVDIFNKYKTVKFTCNKNMTIANEEMCYANIKYFDSIKAEEIVFSFKNKMINQVIVRVTPTGYTNLVDRCNHKYGSANKIIKSVGGEQMIIWKFSNGLLATSIEKKRMRNMFIWTVSKPLKN